MKLFAPLITAATLLSQPLAAQDWASIETFGGLWDTNWGETWAWQTDYGYQGSYEADNGTFWLEFTGHVFEGYWAEGHSDQRCDVEYMGSYYWGRLQLANSARYPGVEMTWGYCRSGRVDKVWQFRERLPDGL